MSLPVGQPSVVAYMSIAQSKRWNRQPIKTGSDYDDHVGGGVSLTAVSDFDDSTHVPSCSRVSNGKDEKPVTLSSTLNANAKPFRSTVQVEASTRSTSSEISTTSSASVMSSAAQPNTVQPAASEGETVCYILNPVSPEVLHYSNQFLFCVINRVEIGQLKQLQITGRSFGSHESVLR